MNYPREIGWFNGEGFTSIAQEWLKNGACMMVADMDVDVDGSLPNIYHDPYYQADTTLHYEGKALNTDEDSWAVLPPGLISSVKGIVLGCQGLAVNLLSGLSYPFVVGDVGPTRKNGEGSRRLAKGLAIDPDPNNGGADGMTVLYVWWPGIAAIVNDRHYVLKNST